MSTLVFELSRFYFTWVGLQILLGIVLVFNHPTDTFKLIVIDCNKVSSSQLPCDSAGG